MDMGYYTKTEREELITRLQPLVDRDDRLKVAVSLKDKLLKAARPYLNGDALQSTLELIKEKVDQATKVWFEETQALFPDIRKDRAWQLANFRSSVWFSESQNSLNIDPEGEGVKSLYREDCKLRFRNLGAYVYRELKAVSTEYTTRTKKARPKSKTIKPRAIRLTPNQRSMLEKIDVYDKNCKAVEGKLDTISPSMSLKSWESETGRTFWSAKILTNIELFNERDIARTAESLLAKGLIEVSFTSKFQGYRRYPSNTVISFYKLTFSGKELIRK